MSQIKKRIKMIGCSILALVLTISCIPTAFAAETEPTWETVSPLKDAKCEFSPVALDGKIYVCGGKTTKGEISNTVEQYDTLTGKWNSMAPMPDKTCEAQTAVINGMIYVVNGIQNYGGSNNTPNNVYIYNPASNVWTTTKNDIGRVDHQVAVVNGKLYIIGGRNLKSDYDDSFSSTVEMYNPETNTWVSKAPMHTARAYFSVAVVNGKIYAFGGIERDETKKVNIVLNTAEEYDPETDTWTFIRPMNPSRSAQKSVVLNNKIYLIGGSTTSSDGTTDYLNRVDEYDTSTDTWTAKAPMNARRICHELVASNGIIYCIGGKSVEGKNNNIIYYNSVEAYDPKANTWMTKTPMAAKRNFFGACVTNNAIYAIGGFDETTSPLSSVEKYTLPSTIVQPSLTATGENSKVDLSWGAVTDATGYNVYRSTTAGGPYTKIAEEAKGTTYTDADVTNGTTYYYVVTTVTSSGESAYSNEASATPKKAETGKALLELYMVDGTQKEYDLTMDKIDDFIAWYDARSAGTGKPYYVFEKSYNKGPFKIRTEHIIFDKIRDFEVNQYD